MKLNKRASLLILPVVLAAYIAAALSVYQLQANTVRKAEQLQLSLAMTELKSTFDNYSRFTSNYLFTLLNGNVLKHYLNERNEYLRARTLGISLEKALLTLLQDSSAFTSIALIRPGEQLLYYYENSEDPFAEIASEQLSFATTLLQSDRYDHRQLLNQGVRPLLIYGNVIDSETLLPPVNNAAHSTLVIQIAIEPVELSRRIQRIEAKYGQQIVFSRHQPADPAGRLITTRLAPGLVAYLEIPPDHFETLLAPLRQQLALAVAGLSIATLVILILLIRRYITAPIAKLDLQLTAVMQRQLENISLPAGNDEISHLGNSFRTLYQRLSDAYETTRKLSLTDSLTTLPNRSCFTQRLTAALEQTPDDTVALLFLDLDNFKFVNDHFGHDTGDKLLRSFAHRTQTLLRSQSSSQRKADNIVFARLSGDEFAILIQQPVDPHGATRIAQRIIRQFDQGFSIDNVKYPVSASIGIALYPQDADHASQLISNADDAMYQAKSEGKNRYALYSADLAQKARQLKEIEQQLRSIDFDAEFYLTYMPILNRSGEVSHCEVLLRWRSPTLGLISPELFIPIAESTGRFEAIDRWVLNQAFAALPALQARFGEQIVLSVNLSAAELNNALLERMLLDALSLYQVEACHFELEITETFNINHRKHHNEVLQRLRTIGFRIVIDDFGTGYTSMLQLVEYPVDKIKLDKTFTEKLTQPRQRNLLKPIIELCHSQQIEVTAEGIETLQQQSLLEQAGCDYFQGYLICKPQQLADLPPQVRRPQARLSSVQKL